MAVTVPTGVPVSELLETVDHVGRREDAALLMELFRERTGWEPTMWGPSIIGYGRYDYTYDSGHSGKCFATGFSPRKANMVVYIMPGYQDYSEILSRLGPHKLGKSCLYLGRLNKIDMSVLGELIEAGVEDLKSRWPVSDK